MDYNELSEKLFELKKKGCLIDVELKMAGIDYCHANIQQRELFSYTKSTLAETMIKLKEKFHLSGCVVISTCNRTELWVSGKTDISLVDMLCDGKDLSNEEKSNIFIQREGMMAVHYLMELACGLNSQIFGEDQILTQIKDALLFAREQHTIGTVLEILFRDAVTAAKKVKSNVRLTVADRSMAVATIELLKQQFESLQGICCMVIGNGEMGRLVASELVKQHCKVMMTMRQYKHQDVMIPGGCRVLNYDERVEKLSEQQIVISATRSPHHTLKYEEIAQILSQKPIVLVDLAVPRDIDPELEKLDTVTLYNVDDLGDLSREKDQQQIQKAKRILSEYEQDFEDWYDLREWIPTIEKIGKQTSLDIVGRTKKQLKQLSIDETQRYQFRRNMDIASQKAVMKLLFDLREHLDREEWKRCVIGLEEAVEQSKRKEFA